MSDQLAIEAHADMVSLGPLLERIDGFGMSQGWPENILSQVHLVLEEIIVNVISHGTVGQVVPKLEVVLTRVESQLEIQISDNAMAFNPLRAEAPNLDASLEERAVGGLGVFLICQLMDTVSYRRDGEWNRLLMTKTIQ